MQLVKIAWGRVRFDDLGVDFRNATPALYTPWYVPNGPNGEKSFPSGHASMGAIMFGGGGGGRPQGAGGPPRGGGRLTV